MNSQLPSAFALALALLALSACVSGQNGPGTGKRSVASCSEKVGLIARANAARAAGQGGNIYATPAELAAINECAGLPVGTNMSGESAVFQQSTPATPLAPAVTNAPPATSGQICTQQMVGGTSYACQ
ncbi:MAG: hypothetical protein WAT77_17025 [Paracoccaceae bacterium]|mgnify:CR=1 FL=1